MDNTLKSSGTGNSKTECESQIRKFYAGKYIFLTGCTGFVGTLILEKLLRTCNDISKIYVLIRPKKEQPTEERLNKRFKNIVFDELRKVNPNFMQKVVPIEGDLYKADLGISPEDRKRLVENVNIIIHNASIVHFEIRASIILRTNVVATQKMLELAKECSHLEIFTYVSTTFSHFYNKEIEEKFYPPPADMKLIEDIIRADEAVATGLSKKTLSDIIGNFCNLYIFSKATAEGVVENFGRTSSFPCIVCRPSIVLTPCVEPTRAWIANYNGGFGPCTLCVLGILHVVPGSANTVSDVIPGDMTVNHLLALIWDHVRHRNSIKSEFYNFASSDWNPVTYKCSELMMYKTIEKFPSMKMVWYPFVIYAPNIYVFMVLHILLHFIPAAIADLIFIVKGKKPMALTAVWKITKLLRVLRPFLERTWVIKADKAKDLRRRMNSADLKEFNFDMSKIDWNEFGDLTAYGIRVALNETDDTIPLARKRLQKLKILHYTTCTLLVILLFFLLHKITCCIFCHE